MRARFSKIHRLCGGGGGRGRNKVRSREECRMRLDLKADKGYTPLKLNGHQNVEDDVAIAQEDLNT